MTDPRHLPVLPSGQILDLADPASVVVVDVDLRTGVTNGRRYAGQLDVSVLAHLALCVMLGRLRRLPTEDIAHLAAHDLHEAYVGDLIYTWKRAVPAIVDVERQWHAHVLEALGLDGPIPASVKSVDSRAVAVEAWTWEHPHVEHHLRHHGGEPNDREVWVGRTVRRMVESETGRAAAWGLVVEAITNHVGAWRADSRRAA